MEVDEGIAFGVKTEVDVDVGKITVDVELGTVTEATVVLVETLVVIKVTKVGATMVKTRLDSVGA